MLITSSRDQSHDIQGALFKPFNPFNPLSTRPIGFKLCKHLQRNVLKMKIEMIAGDIRHHLTCQVTLKGQLFKALYLLNYMLDGNETLHVSTEGSVIHEN